MATLRDWAQNYDNSKIAVSKTAGGHGREVTREFLRLAGHYLFEHHFCLVRRPNEKGHVENLIGYARRNYPHRQLNQRILPCGRLSMVKHLLSR